MPLPLEPSIDQVDLPVIDISEFLEDLDGEDLSQLRDHPLLAKLRKACKEWGLFYLVNHGIPVEILDKSQKASRDLLSMPIEVKDRVTTSKPIDSYYRSPNFETFGFPDTTKSDSIAQTCLKIWPEGNANFSETTEKYAVCVSKLSEKVTKMILLSLGLDAKAFYHSHFEKCTAKLHINGYSSEKKLIGEETLPSHADSACLTVLYQDDVGGLQIRSQEGEWFNVKPLSHSFVVNLGDSFKAWTNGGYRSAVHRVVCKGWINRMSIAFITTFPMEMEIWAPAELVDDNNPRRYKPFQYSLLKHEVQTNKEIKDRTTFLELFAGI
ncbi:hypothetical protein SUGI_0852590 [Cryptomeria japonica]|uniref:2-oxoglutarate-dependent dioxygenase DAO n=1 Tax=Cryptomeria japonica TaxID=3369 RepID=UPI002414A974|nr:2-oxoglutarate-dependent dioxygenase DAO [Cryptomeria japonica]GLJ41182.1 hypothetical protein SUGI_0852590 [Cryptomeria japonica]